MNCKVCNENKAITEFEHQKNRPNPRKICKSCRYERKLKTTTKDQIERRNATRRKNAAAGKYKLANKKWYLKNLYGLEYEDFINMLQSQGHKCKICTCDLNSIDKSKVHVDHSHSTGKVRGILCSACNTAIGLFKENMNSLMNALAYLAGH